MDIGAIFDAILVVPMMWGLQELAHLTGSAGLAIILFTLFIRALLLPFSLYQSKAQKAMMALQPELKAIQQKYRNDRERLTQETMRVYKEHGVNPAAGCLPLLLQLPVFYGLYYALFNLGRDPNLAGSRGVEAFREPFLWLPSLAQPDAIHLPLPGLEAVPIPGPLPLFMAATQYYMSKMMQTPTSDPQMESMNRMMTIFMPLMLLFFGVTFPSGLVLYWAASNLFSIVQQGFVTGWSPLLPGGGKQNGSATPAGVSAPPTPNGASPSAEQPRAVPTQRSVKAHKTKGKKRGKR